MQLEMCLSSSLSKSKTLSIHKKVIFFGVKWSINEPVYPSWGFDDGCD